MSTIQAELAQIACQLSQHHLVVSVSRGCYKPNQSVAGASAGAGAAVMRLHFMGGLVAAVEQGG